MKKLLDFCKVGLLIAALALVMVPGVQAAADASADGDIIIITDDCFGPADDCLIFYPDGSIRITSYWIIIIVV